MSKIQQFLDGKISGYLVVKRSAASGEYNVTFCDPDSEPVETSPMLPASALDGLRVPSKPIQKRVLVPGMSLAVLVSGDSAQVQYPLAGRWISFGEPLQVRSVTLLSKAREAIACHPGVDHDLAEQADIALSKLEDAEGPIGIPA